MFYLPENESRWTVQTCVSFARKSSSSHWGFVQRRLCEEEGRKERRGRHETVPVNREEVLVHAKSNLICLFCGSEAGAPEAALWFR